MQATSLEVYRMSNDRKGMLTKIQMILNAEWIKMCYARGYIAYFTCANRFRRTMLSSTSILIPAVKYFRYMRNPIVPSERLSSDLVRTGSAWKH